MHKSLIANITWNRKNWSAVDILPQAGHRYVRNSAGHECLNFDFKKKGIDTDELVYGYFQRTNEPKKLEKNGIIIFFSKNVITNVNYVVGIYGHAEILTKDKIRKYIKFENNEYWTNIRARKEFSLILSTPIKFNKNIFGVERVGMCGYSYLKNDRVTFILDEIIKKQNNPPDLKKLEKIKKHYISNNFKLSHLDIEDTLYSKEQLFFKNKITNNRIKEIDLENSHNHMKPKLAISKHYPRDSELSSGMKQRVNHICQICEIPTFRTKKKIYYTESHHIHPLSLGGLDISSNIVIVCSNCHKKFDKGNDKTLIEIYKILKEKKIFSNFDALKRHRVISDLVFNNVI